MDGLVLNNNHSINQSRLHYYNFKKQKKTKKTHKIVYLGENILLTLFH
jgi:hypothetical protein